MSPSTAYTLTTAIDYVNAPPHVGHAYEKIAADVMARFMRLQGREVFFLTGTDEHGMKVEKTAATRGMSPKEHVDDTVRHFKDAWALLNIQYDRFIRTTDSDHVAVVQHLWTLLKNSGDIYKASYTGLYCTGCETFLNERDLTEAGHCAIHQSPPEPVTEENWFFRLTAYKERLLTLLNTPGFIQPAFRLPELLNMVDNLQDISVSRPVSSVSWGIPVPEDDNQRIYVWIDALSNYITGTGYLHNDALFSKHWPADCHLIGKDILRFHALYWPAMLMAANLPLPKSLYAHGFININDAKISKSLGNTVAPQDILTRFELPNADPLRYYLMTVSPFGQDGNFTEDDFKAKVNADLANNLGNLLNRTLTMAGKFCGGHVPAYTDTSPLTTDKGDVVEFRPITAEDLAAIADAYEQFQFQTASERIIELVDRGNKLIHQAEPWALAKVERHDDVERVLYAALESLRQVAIVLSPITPTLCAEIFTQLGYLTGTLETQTWADVLTSPLPSGQALKPAGPILPRLEDELVGAGGKKK